MKPEGPRPEQSPSPAPGDTAPHPAEASLWEQFLSRANLAEALRRVEQNAGAAGIDGMSTKELRPWLRDHWPEVRSAARGGHLPAAARAQGDDPQALGRATEAGGAGCGGSVDLPGHRAGAHAHLRSAFPSPQLRVSPGALAASRCRSGHASSSLMTRRGALILISTRFSIEFSTTL